MKYEKAWADSISDDLKGISESEFNRIDAKLDSILDFPNQKSSRIKNMIENIRRIRIGNHRLIIYVKNETMTVYALAYLPRKLCYKKEKLKMYNKISKTLTGTNIIY